MPELIDLMVEVFSQRPILDRICLECILDDILNLKQAVNYAHLDCTFSIKDKYNKLHQFNSLTMANIKSYRAIQTQLGIELIQHSRYDRLDLLEAKLLRREIPINLIHMHRETILMKSVKNGRVKVVQRLLKRPDIQVNFQDKDGQTALMTASQESFSAEANCIEIVRLLLARSDLDLNLQDKYGYSALMLAVNERSARIIELLLSKPGLNLDLKTRHGETAITLAEKRKSYEIVKLLQKYNRGLH